MTATTASPSTSTTTSDIERLPPTTLAFEIVDSFWDVQTSSQTASDGREGKTTAEMQTARTFLEARWDLIGEAANGTEDIWRVCEGLSYPKLARQIQAGDFVCPDGITGDDFVIFAERWLEEDCGVNNHYCQGADLDFSGAVDPMISQSSWISGWRTFERTIVHQLLTIERCRAIWF